ncbi:MAG: GLUG motif-containing protein, partial [Candidatus ainarchaeum sp.]|nr:GLUG motif-containing protein [Candidatus ainarchaeum sp.]
MNYKLNLVIFIFFFLSTIVLAFSGGSGTISDPFIITNCIELQDMNTNLDANYALGNDINCYSATREEGVLWNNGLGFQPIGGNNNFFKGSINGRNHQVIGLYIYRETIVDTTNWYTDYSGLIGVGRGVLIKNLGLVDVEIKGGIYAGGLAGAIFSNNDYFEPSSIINSFVTGKISARKKDGRDYGNVGGLVGNASVTEIINSYFDGNITGKYKIGGLVGVNGDATIIKNSFVSGLITCDNCSYVGGLVGDYYSGTIDNSFNSAEINAVSGYYVGGLAGSITTSTISNSFSAKSASGSEYVGKLIGEVTSNYGISNLNNLFCV